MRGYGLLTWWRDLERNLQAWMAQCFEHQFEKDYILWVAKRGLKHVCVLSVFFCSKRTHITFNFITGTDTCKTQQKPNHCALHLVMNTGIGFILNSCCVQSTTCSLRWFTQGWNATTKTSSLSKGFGDLNGGQLLYWLNDLFSKGTEISSQRASERASLLAQRSSVRWFISRLRGSYCTTTTDCCEGSYGLLPNHLRVVAS